MKKIFLYAYSHQNLGDDLFIEMICKRYEHIKFYMICEQKYISAYKDIDNLRIIKKDGFLISLLAKIRSSFVPRYISYIQKKCVAVVYIGGSIFIEYDSWKNSINWWDYESRHYPLFILGANFGPYATARYRESFAEIFDHVYDICFRDKKSYNLFSKSDHVRYAPDIIFGYPVLRKPNREKIVFISVINCQIKNEGKVCELSKLQNLYVNFLIDIIHIYKKMNYKIILSSFCKEEGDEKTIIDILKKVNKEEINILDYTGNNRKEVIDTLASSSIVIGSRFHAVILALKCKIPVLPIIYSDKTKNVLKDINFNGKYIDLRDGLKIQEKKSEKEYNVESIIKKSESHFKALDDFLRDF